MNFLLFIFTRNGAFPPDSITMQNQVYTTTEYVNQKPSSYIDKTGLMTWRGNAIAVSGIVGGGATYLHFNLKSDCITSEEVSVSIDTGGGALGIGKVVTGTTSTVEFEDNDDAIDAKLRVRYYYAGIGFAFIGMGYSVGGFRLGDAVSYSFASFTNIREVEICEFKSFISLILLLKIS